MDAARCAPNIALSNSLCVNKIGGYFNSIVAFGIVASSTIYVDLAKQHFQGTNSFMKIFQALKLPSVTGLL